MTNPAHQCGLPITHQPPIHSAAPKTRDAKEPGLIQLGPHRHLLRTVSRGTAIIGITRGPELAVTFDRYRLPHPGRRGAALRRTFTTSTKSATEPTVLL